jgi:hypothetical protein
VIVEGGERELREISLLSFSPLFASMQFVIHSSLHTLFTRNGAAETACVERVWYVLSAGMLIVPATAVLLLLWSLFQLSFCCGLLPRLTFECRAR